MADLTCGCPGGFRPDDFGLCEDVTSQAPIDNGDQLTVATVTSNVNYSIYGAYFFQSISNRPWPISQTQVGVTDSVITQDFFTQDLDIEQVIPGLPWKNRLSTVGVWTTIAPNPLSEWIGFSFCVEVDEARTFFIGFGSTTHIRITINDQVAYIAQHSTTPKYKRWQVIPVDLPLGVNNILVEGFNPGGTAVMGMEVYDATLVQLQAATPTTILDYIIASTQDRAGETFDSGEDTGYSCNVGFHLEKCSGILRCVQREITELLPCCMILVNCQDPSQTLSTKTDLTAYLGQVVNVQLFDGCWTVTESTLPCEEFQELTVTDSFEDCEECIPVDEVCYTLTNCEDEEEILKVKGPLGGYVGQVVQLENFDGCWTVTESEDACFPVIEAQIKDYFSTCEACLPSDCCEPKPCCNECL